MCRGWRWCTGCAAAQPSALASRGRHGPVLWGGTLRSRPHSGGRGPPTPSSAVSGEGRLVRREEALRAARAAVQTAESRATEQGRPARTAAEGDKGASPSPASPDLPLEPQALRSRFLLVGAGLSPRKVPDTPGVAAARRRKDNTRASAADSLSSCAATLQTAASTVRREPGYSEPRKPAVPVPVHAGSGSPRLSVVRRPGARRDR